MNKPILETDRLLLRPFRRGDEEGILAFSSNEETQRLTGDKVRTTIKEAQFLIDEVWLKDYELYGYGRFAVIHKTDNRIIGFNGIKFLPELGEADLGYRFLPEYWGKGIATESSRCILSFAFNDIGLETVIACAFPENKGSLHVLEKLGFKFEKLGPFPGEDIKMLHWYRLQKKEYEG